eukprot:TRINITY_DN4477_c0_g2_i2.p1 TRINITY_DN4477_c0_g2~~TRINITY_DN4477_c0_g2_i2.p1  ORF type:complete len:214 (+),score=29.69 TRINITY_DN4477_c0_g2_i2:290-931(+)
MNNNNNNNTLLIAYTLLLLLFLISSANSAIPKDDSPKYEVVIMSEEDFDPEPGSTKVEMTSVDGEKYDCYIPPEPIKKGASNVVAPTSQTIASTLALLEDTCLYRMTGWWTYELCHGRYINQFHAEKDDRIVENSLGKLLDVSYIAKSGILKNFKAGQVDGASHSKPYFSVTYEDGAVCDLTGLPRTSEVRYFCDPKGLNSIVEYPFILLPSL